MFKENICTNIFNSSCTKITKIFVIVIIINKENTKTLIDRRRNVLYWSLGAFYAALPIFMILQGITADMASAAADSHLRVTEDVEKTYRTLVTASVVVGGLTIGLGINYAVQLGLYLYAADQSIPKEASKSKRNR